MMIRGQLAAGLALFLALATAAVADDCTEWVEGERYRGEGVLFSFTSQPGVVALDDYSPPVCTVDLSWKRIGSMGDRTPTRIVRNIQRLTLKASPQVPDLVEIMKVVGRSTRVTVEGVFRPSAAGGPLLEVDRAIMVGGRPVDLGPPSPPVPETPLALSDEFLQILSDARVAKNMHTAAARHGVYLREVTRRLLSREVAVYAFVYSNTRPPETYANFTVRVDGVFSGRFIVVSVGELNGAQPIIEPLPSGRP